MLANLDTTELLVLTGALVLGAFFVSQFVNSILGPQGFGPIGTVVILVAGAFIGLYAAQHYQLPSRDYVIQGVCAIAGGFGTLFAAMILKMIFRRMGF